MSNNKKDPPKTNSKTRKDYKQKKARFDEENIARTYHPEHKSYGFMKIEEPPTPAPQHRAPINPRELTQKLLMLEKEDSSHIDLNTQKDDFERKRKAVYNQEFIKAREALRDLKDKDNDREQKKTRRYGLNSKGVMKNIQKKSSNKMEKIDRNQ